MGSQPKIKDMTTLKVIDFTEKRKSKANVGLGFNTLEEYLTENAPVFLDYDIYNSEIHSKDYARRYIVFTLTQLNEHMKKIKNSNHAYLLDYFDVGDVSRNDWINKSLKDRLWDIQEVESYIYTAYKLENYGELNTLFDIVYCLHLANSLSEVNSEYLALFTSETLPDVILDKSRKLFLKEATKQLRITVSTRFQVAIEHDDAHYIREATENTYKKINNLGITVNKLFYQHKKQVENNELSSLTEAIKELNNNIAELKNK